jgi:hypothetical protein
MATIQHQVYRILIPTAAVLALFGVITLGKALRIDTILLVLFATFAGILGGLLLRTRANRLLKTVFVLAMIAGPAMLLTLEWNARAGIVVTFLIGIQSSVAWYATRNTPVEHVDGARLSILRIGCIFAALALIAIAGSTLAPSAETIARPAMAAIFALIGWVCLASRMALLGLCSLAGFAFIISTWHTDIGLFGYAVVYVGALLLLVGTHVAVLRRC